MAVINPLALLQSYAKTHERKYIVLSIAPVDGRSCVRSRTFRRSSRATAAITGFQSAGSLWRKRRIVGYQVERPFASVQRQSAGVASSVQTGIPIAPAR